MAVAYFALFSWPVVAFLAFRRFEVPLAILVTLIFGYLFLPTQISVNLPVLPTLDKNTIPAFAVLALVLLVFKKSLSAPGTTTFIPRSALARLCLVTFVFGAFFTAATNDDPLQYGPIRLPALRTYDAFSIILAFFSTLVPFFLAHKFLAHPEKQRLFLKIFVLAALIYTLPALYEVRMSPQLNRMVYGFFPHNFLQHMRGNGFRPVVFLEHGLVLAIFMTMALVAAIGLTRLEPPARKTRLVLAAIWLFFTLVLCKSLGALAIALALIPMALLLTVRLQLMMAVGLFIIFLSYPVLRTAGYVPVDRINAYAESVDPMRAASLRVRLENEDDFLAKVAERPVFGWGGYGRSRVFAENGTDTSIADGAWVMTLGVGGWVRYLAQFGLYCLPAFYLFWFRRHLNLTLETSILTLMLAANILDLIPNASQTPLTWMLAGCLWGRLSLGRVSHGLEEEKAAAPKRGVQYARPHPKRPPRGVTLRARRLVPTEHKG
ncbi:hypothetical protein [Roseobacter weihaiensis]|uniref:hypothetical protein n=1 Tax=Roseobacter weihaiensis TaxID=2763262 RepID=UPI001D0A3B39|nr:hypothetical protein [Roseobacter sp. H9]